MQFCGFEQVAGHSATRHDKLLGLRFSICHFLQEKQGEVFVAWETIFLTAGICFLSFLSMNIQSLSSTTFSLNRKCIHASVDLLSFDLLL